MISRPTFGPTRSATAGRGTKLPQAATHICRNAGIITHSETPTQSSDIWQGKRPHQKSEAKAPHTGCARALHATSSELTDGRPRMLKLKGAFAPRSPHRLRQGAPGAAQRQIASGASDCRVSSLHSAPPARHCRPSQRRRTSGIPTSLLATRDHSEAIFASYGATQRRGPTRSARRAADVDQ